MHPDLSSNSILACSSDSSALPSDGKWGRPGQAELNMHVMVYRRDTHWGSGSVELL